MNLLENAIVQEQRRIEYMIKKYETELTTLPKGALIAKMIKEINITIYSIAAGKDNFEVCRGEQETKLKNCSNRLNGAGIFRSCLKALLKNML
ncbi:MAG: hypothetical protein ACLTER_11095 [Ruminococcus sp.]